MLHEDQQKAITFGDGTCLVLAGPGAGKTYVLTRRVRHLVHTMHIPGDAILVITFTKAAALEMKQRYEALSGGTDGVCFGTFHAISYDILKEEEHIGRDALLEEKMKRTLLYDTAKALHIDAGRYPSFLSSMTRALSFVKNADILPEEYAWEDMSPEQFAAFYHAYHRRLSHYEKMDYDDMLLRVRSLFCSHSDVLKKWQARFRYVMVDEAQDMNRMQYDIVRLIGGERGNLFFVGDDDQSIYGFRAANPAWMLHFTEDFPSGSRLVLSANHRSDRAIIAAANRLIAHNTLRVQKTQRAESDAEGAIMYLQAKDVTEEAELIARHIAAEHRADPSRTIAVLFRNHSGSGEVVARLKERLLAVRYDKKQTDAEDEFMLDIASYLRLMTGAWRREDVLRVMNRPGRMLPREGIEGELVQKDAWQAYYTHAPEIVKRIDAFYEEVAFAGEGVPSLVVLKILKRMGYWRFIMDKAKSEEGKRELTKKRDAVMTMARKSTSLTRLLHMIENIGDEKKAASEEVSEDNAICLSTFHGSKGLEFDHVYIIDACEGITPAKRARHTEETEEERRMFYVALTRAKHAVTIATAARREGQMLYPSRFIREMTQDQTDFS